VKRILADTAKITQHWEHRCDELPYLMVRMSDGREIRYNPEIPHPGFVKAMDIIEKMTVGYPISKE
jgi:hypothetical protein